MFKRKIKLPLISLPGVVDGEIYKSHMTHMYIENVFMSFLGEICRIGKNKILYLDDKNWI